MRVVKIDEYAVVIRAYVWSEDPIKSWDLFCDINKAVLEDFRENGIEIPVPYRKIING